jgi:hypothetical protein
MTPDSSLPGNLALCVATGFALLSTAQAAAPLLPDGACAVVRKAVAKRDRLPESGPAGLGWFCDITPAKDSRLFIIALRTSRPTPYDNLVVWYAVDRTSGALFIWNVKEQRTQPFGGPAGER